MPHMAWGFGLFGLIEGIIGVAVAIAFIWLLYRLSKLADAYAAKLKAKNE
jgi:hypothetical protein